MKYGFPKLFRPVSIRTACAFGAQNVPVSASVSVPEPSTIVTTSSAVTDRHVPSKASTPVMLIVTVAPPRPSIDPTPQTYAPGTHGWGVDLPKNSRNWPLNGLPAAG